MRKLLIAAVCLPLLAAQQIIYKRAPAAPLYGLPTATLEVQYDISEGSGQALTDLSGNGNDGQLGTAGDSDATDPTWTTSGGETVLSHGTGAGQIWTVPNVTASFSGSGTVIYVLKMDAAPQASVGNSGLGVFGTSSSPDHWPYTNGAIYNGALSTTRPNSGTPLESLTAWHVVSVTSTAGAWQLFLNQTSQYSTGTNTFGLPTAIRMGVSSGSQRLVGQSAYFLLYSSVLDADDLKSAYCYIRQEKPGLGLPEGTC